MTTLTVHLSAIAQNIRLLKGLLNPNVCLLSVVKADGYGHGAAETAKTALANGAGMLAVASAEEGAQLREKGIEAPILILGLSSGTQNALCVRYRLIATVADSDGIRALDSAAGELHAHCEAHLKIDTGMGRIGVRSTEEALRIAGLAASLPHVEISGFFTHFATADDTDTAFLDEQDRRFRETARVLHQLLPAAKIHAANSAALFRGKAFHYDMVRPGITQYIQTRFPYTPTGFMGALTWSTRSVFVKEIEPGDSVGYGCSFTADHPMRIMTLPVGYGDGYPRAVGNAGFVLIRGKRAPVVGHVCMDQCMIDVTGIPEASVGDEAVLLGRQGSDEIGIYEFAAWAGITEYEALLSPTGRVRKVFVP